MKHVHFVQLRPSQSSKLIGFIGMGTMTAYLIFFLQAAAFWGKIVYDGSVMEEKRFFSLLTLVNMS